MISKDIISNLTEKYLEDNGLFLVDISINQENDIEVAIESDQNVDIKHCVDLSHIIEAGLNREEEDYSLTVTSAGLDQPFKVLRQYLKFKGQEVEIVLKSGCKIVAVLEDATQEQITVGYEKLVKVEGKKKRERIAVKETYKYEEIKSTKPFINFR